MVLLFLFLSAVDIDLIEESTIFNKNNVSVVINKSKFFLTQAWVAFADFDHPV